VRRETSEYLVLVWSPDYLRITRIIFFIWIPARIFAFAKAAHSHCFEKAVWRKAQRNSFVHLLKWNFNGSRINFILRFSNVADCFHPVLPGMGAAPRMACTRARGVKRTARPWVIIALYFGIKPVRSQSAGTTGDLTGF